MSQKCPHCRADLQPHESCRDRFDLCLALEFENPAAFGAVHHLTVACYMLQHNAYSRDVWVEARNMVAQFIHEGITPAAMRRQIRAKVDSGQRSWRVTQGPKLAEFDTIVWSRTIADVRLDSPEIYCRDVELWARSVIADTEAFVTKTQRKRYEE